VPIKMTETNGRVWSRAPKLGEHTPEVLGRLGYSDSDIASLRERRIAG
jgi:crotonobetainyl-CoA:carnitine CoA-transferase CaiB-like acyl-CoA transferase